MIAKRLLALLFALALVAAACGDDAEETTTTTAAATTTTAAATTTTAAPTTTEAPPAAEGGTIIIGTTDTVASLDAADAYATRDWEMMKNFGEGLIKWQTGSADVLVPGLAEALPVASADGLSYTVTLRDGLVFGDGTAIDNQLVADQLTRLLTISETGPNKVGLTLGTPYVESVEASGDRDVVFNLTQPLAFFPQVLASVAYHVTHPDIFPLEELNVFPEAPVYGTGAWNLVEFIPAEQAVFEPNPNYQGDSPAQLDRVIVRHFADPQTMAQAVQAGEIDVAWRILGAELAEQLGAVDGLNSFVVPAGPIRYLIVNHTMEPTSDPNVQKALASSIDRDELSDVVFGGAVEPLLSPVPPGFLGANEAFDDLYGSPDLEAARGFLEDSGYSEDNKLQLDFWYPPEHYGATTADGVLLIAEQFEATGMIDVNTQAQEWSTYVSAVTGGEDYPLSVLGWFFDFPDPENYLQPFIEGRGLGTNVTDADSNLTPGIDPALLELLTASRAITDVGERAEVLGDLQNVYADEVVTIPLWLEPEFVVYRDGVLGDSGLPNPNTLNIGPTMEFIYSVLSLAS